MKERASYRISLIDKVRRYLAKNISENPKQLEDAFLKPIILRHISGKWENEGILLKEQEGEYLFLTRNYGNPLFGGRGNIITGKGIEDTCSMILKKDNMYILKTNNGGSGWIVDEGDTKSSEDKYGLGETYKKYDAILRDHGLMPMKEIN